MSEVRQPYADPRIFDADSDLRPRYAWSIPGFVSEKPSSDPKAVEAWCYTDRFSYYPGETINVHVHTTSDTYSLRLVRDGANPRMVWERSGLRGAVASTPEDSYAVGCGWPVALTIPVEADWPTGFYQLIISVVTEGRLYEHEHFAVIKRARSEQPSAHALVLTTSTLLAYNDWGGANHYRGVGDDPWTDLPSVRSSTQRPIARGMIRQPEGAPRSSNPDTPGPAYIPRHPAYEWAHSHGYSRHYADAFWGTYERHFVIWAEQNGYELDYLTQHDLHHEPDSLERYRCAIFVGHDEYWTWEMRDVVETFVDAGGRVARFAGNFCWQVRFEDGGQTQICYKMPSDDPVAETDPQRTTTVWDAPVIGRPGASTFGLTGLGGVYNRYGSAAARSSGGFTVYRPRHWALEGTGLGYGDVFGGAPTNVAAFELDGVDYTFHRGMPQPTGADGAPDGLEILAMAPATFGELDQWEGAVRLGAPLDEALAIIDSIFGDERPDRFTDEFYGAGMIATFTRARGEVFCAGSTEWVNGLRLADPFTERITHNVLRRYAEENAWA